MSDDKKVIFSMQKLSKSYPGADKQVLKNIYLSFFYGAKIGILGLNGSGKSSLLKIIAGVDKNYQGDVVFQPGYTVGYLEQEPLLDETKTVIDIVREGAAETFELLAEFNKINDDFGLPEVYENPEKMEKLMDRQAELQDKIDACGAWEIDTKLEIAMDALRTPDPETPINVLSGGEKRRVALCRLLLQQPDVLLLDEPTNHLDAESVLWLEQKSNRMAQEEKVASKRRKNLERELDWVRQGAKGRQTKQKARLQNYDKLLNEDQKELDEKLEIYIPNGPRLGTNVIEAKNVAKAFGDKLLYDDLNFVLPQAGIVGIIGPNGAGKSTIFKMIMGEQKADAGTFDIGETVKIAYVDQSHSNIDVNKTLWENFCDGQELIMMGGRQVNSRAYLSRFNFGGSDQNKKVATLSGGERNRLHLAMTLKEEGNVLLLDEPTNDLDVNTLRALEEGLENFAGCAVIISHDRWFLDRVCTHILAFEGDSQVYSFEGSFTEYEENKRKRLGKDVTPTRIKYKKLIR